MSEGLKLINFNIGVVGHVDSGKTSLVRRLSQVASTAAFDKNRQSQERGITLDLGFSSFALDLPPNLEEQIGSVYSDSSCKYNHEKVQVTLVDCPGHASLIRTVIAAAQIIDLMILVVDVLKGIQTQTGECLVLGELVDNCDHLIVVINKIDLVPDGVQRKQVVEKLKRRILKVLETTKFKDSPIVPVAASPSSVTEKDGEAGNSSSFDSNPFQSIGLDDLKETLSNVLFIPRRTRSDPRDLLMAVDHCFSIRGQGSVVTGTVIQGSVRVNDTVEISSLKIQKKVKSMQMFKKPVNEASQGDRVAICVTQFDPKLLERGFISYPNLIKTAFAFVASINRIKHFRDSIKSKSKLHITLMHETVMGIITLFTHSKGNVSTVETQSKSRENRTETEENETETEENRTETEIEENQPGIEENQPGIEENLFDSNQEYEYLDELGTDLNANPDAVFALIQLQGTISATNNSLLIASKLDADINSNSCRIAFSGKVRKIFTSRDYVELKELNIFKMKSKEGIVERYSNEYEVIVKNLFKKETNLQLFNGLKVTLSSGEEGVIDGSFGQSGKIKVRVPSGIVNFDEKSKGKKKDNKTKQEVTKVSLNFKRFMFEKNKKITQ